MSELTVLPPSAPVPTESAASRPLKIAPSANDVRLDTTTRAQGRAAILRKRTEVLLRPLAPFTGGQPTGDFNHQMRLVQLAHDWGMRGNRNAPTELEDKAMKDTVDVLRGAAGHCPYSPGDLFCVVLAWHLRRRGVEVPAELVPPGPDIRPPSASPPLPAALPLPEPVQAAKRDRLQAPAEAIPDERAVVAA